MIDKRIIIIAIIFIIAVIIIAVALGIIDVGTLESIDPIEIPYNDNQIPGGGGGVSP